MDIFRQLRTFSSPVSFPAGRTGGRQMRILSDIFALFVSPSPLFLFNSPGIFNRTYSDFYGGVPDKNPELSRTRDMAGVSRSIVAIAILHNLVLAVRVGVIIAALVFAWDNAKRIRARKSLDANGVKHYEIYGPLFYGSVAAFNIKRDVINDPDQVIIDFEECRVVDMSAIEALNKITER